MAGFLIVMFNFFVLIFLFIDLVIRIVSTIYVYRDSKKRDMNKRLWSLIVFFTPIFIGIVCYFIFRKLDGKMKCPQCGSFVMKNSNNCPICGLVLKKTCPLCGKKVELNWTRCAWCGEQLNEKSIDLDKNKMNK